MLCRLDSSEMGVCFQINGKVFIDTNCMMFTRESFHLLHNWVLMPKYGHLIGDRIITHYINKSNVKMAYSNKPTVNYRSSKEGVYKHFGEEVPQGVMPRPDYEVSFRKWVKDGNPPLI